MGGITPVCLLLLLWAGVTVSSVLDLQKRIVGGQECDKTDRLYHVKLIWRNGNDEYFCGGSLISNQWILTALHCWEDGPGWTVTAVVGVHPGPGTEEKIIAHKIYNLNHDIMLLKLENPTTTIHPNIHPVPLPDCKATSRVPLGKEVQIAGYGAITTDPDDDESTTLQCAKTTVVNCPSAGTTYIFCGRDITVPPTVAVCFGDSGGGVVYNDMIYGVILGDTKIEKVGCTKPVFVDVCRYIDWIKTIVNG